MTKKATESTQSVTDQFRKLDNKVTLAGRIKEFKASSLFQKQDKNGVNYTSVEGTIICDESGSLVIPFKCYETEVYRNNGQVNPNYAKLNGYIDALRANPNEEIFVSLVGSIIDNPYYNKSVGRMMANAIKPDMRFINDFDHYDATIIMEAYIKDITDEEVHDEATGRQKVRLISRDGWNNTIDHTFILPEECVDDFENGGYAPGITAKLKIKWVNVVKENNVVESGGFGDAPGNGTYTNTEMQIVGADAIDKKTRGVQLDDDLIKRALAERKLRIQEIENNKGNFGGFGATPAPAKGGFGAKPADDAAVGQGFMKAMAGDDSVPFDENDEDMDY